MEHYKRTKSEVEIRNGNGKIDKSECKISTAGKSDRHIALHAYICIVVYTSYVYTVKVYKNDIVIIR